MKIELNQKVLSKKGEGLISKIITKSTGYVEVTLNDGNKIKEMAFNLKDGNGLSIKNKPKTSQTCNIQGNNFSREKTTIYTIATNQPFLLREMFLTGNVPDIIQSIVNYAEKYMNISDKQAYVLSKYAFENNINL